MASLVTTAHERGAPLASAPPGGARSTDDGRRRRRDANRAAVLDALAALWREGRLDPRAGEVARRAGISPRSLFRYFDDVQDLQRAAVERELEHLAPLATVEASASAPTATKVAALLRARDRLFDASRAAALAARAVAHRAPLVEASIARSRQHLRDQVARLFAPELERAPGGTLELLDALTSFEAWEARRRPSDTRPDASDRRFADLLTHLLATEAA